MKKDGGGRERRGLLRGNANSLATRRTAGFDCNASTYIHGSSVLMARSIDSYASLNYCIWLAHFLLIARLALACMAGLRSMGRYEPEHSQ